MRQRFSDKMVAVEPYKKARSNTLTTAGRLALAYGDNRCQGRWPEPCREAWPVSRFAWCGACAMITASR